MIEKLQQCGSAKTDIRGFQQQQKSLFPTSNPFPTHRDTAFFLEHETSMLYILGLNPDIEKLYPKVQFPVPKSTPMISPLIKWDHSKSLPVPRWDEHLEPSETIFDVDVTSEESSENYLLDHFIDGRYLYPACGYLFLAWQALAEMIHVNYECLPVVFEDVKIHRATILNKTGEIVFLMGDSS
ncbi:fatty acid synthase [Trichonephila clavipes]|nr:fatty acid synthase [Trichonephila clavipes]